jgi:hypothetical protein
MLCRAEAEFRQVLLDMPECALAAAPVVVSLLVSFTHVPPRPDEYQGKSRSKATAAHARR